MKKFDNSKSVLKNKIKEPTTKPTNKPISNLHFDYVFRILIYEIFVYCIRAWNQNR